MPCHLVRSDDAVVSTGSKGIVALQLVKEVIEWNPLRLLLDSPNNKECMHAMGVLDKHDTHQVVASAEGKSPKLDESYRRCQPLGASSKDRVVPGDCLLVVENLPMHLHGRNSIHGGGEQDDSAKFLGMDNRQHHSLADGVEMGVIEKR